jgi:NAD(P)H-dependent FMN reductase
MTKEHNDGIRIVMILGSLRPGNYTSKAAALVADELRTRHKVALEVFDPATLTLPPPGATTGDARALEAFRRSVADATGVILTTPEYHGGMSSVIKLAIENLGFPSMLAGKPVAMLGVAAGSIGAIKALEQLSGVAMHVGALALPGAVSVANVQAVFDEQGHCKDAAVEKRVRGLATTLIDYIKGAICPRVALEAIVRGESAQGSGRSA